MNPSTLATVVLVSLLGPSGCGARTGTEDPIANHPLNSEATGALGGTVGSSGISAIGGGLATGGTRYEPSANSGGASDLGGAAASGGTLGQASTAAQRSHTCMVGRDPTSQSCTVQCWGDNSFGELGNGTTVNSSLPVAVSGTAYTCDHKIAVAVAAGAFDTCSYLDYGPIYCWGANAYGELGDGTTNGSSLAVTVSGTEQSTTVQFDLVAGLAHHYCSLYGIPNCGYLTCGDMIQCWGDNSHGQLGNATTANSSLPVSVNNISLAVSIAAGSYHSCAALTDGTVRCWGDNSRGQLGDGSTASSAVPVSVLNINNAVTKFLSEVGRYIGAGALHSCVILNDATVQCWGDNTYGQLGNGTTASSLVPVAVAGITNALEIVTGPNHTCAVLKDGTVRCWGDNAYGQLGNGTTAGSLTPVAVFGISEAQHLTVDAYHSCAALSTGAAQCWGDNSAGELGDGTTTSSLVPVTVQTDLELQL